MEGWKEGGGHADLPVELGDDPLPIPVLHVRVPFTPQVQVLWRLASSTRRCWVPHAGIRQQPIEHLCPPVSKSRAHRGGGGVATDLADVIWLELESGLGRGDTEEIVVVVQGCTGHLRMAQDPVLQQGFRVTVVALALLSA